MSAGSPPETATNLRVVLRSGKMIDMTRLQVTTDSVIGWTGDGPQPWAGAGERVAVAASEVRRIQERRFSPFRTMLLLGGSAFVLFGILFLLVLSGVGFSSAPA